ncbi:MAG: hypothetical protein PHY41_03950 [Candidatus Cloacimonetes bacterium]|jgi:hypothetical protein|nr:hypothetical protein [Candidatus Cloacimonadota bacterium]MDD2210565.1 hypothetical protein [Candidatus Cloacimonadota bacterium]MDD3282613.1 hypothetical protein [Candidatus Cloacimonadota bacterium]MDD4687183.1 hypothetical protein [Candidatus Cloacimonadota bacterium]MDY0298621.1 hypothetical protein [Candidatus Cloacimonadaceae bacterium]
MLEALGTKVFSGIVSLSLLLFSSFKGNDPHFGAISVRRSESFIYVSGSLQSAFENDFPSIFSSGTKIPIYFRIHIRQDGKTLSKQRFSHTVSFDTVTGIYELDRGKTNELFRSDSIEDLIREVSKFNFAFPHQAHWEHLNIRIEAELPKVRFEQLNKQVDLMVLWKYKKPSTKAVANLRQLQ